MQLLFQITFTVFLLYIQSQTVKDHNRFHSRNDKRESGQNPTYLTDLSFILTEKITACMDIHSTEGCSIKHNDHRFSTSFADHDRVPLFFSNRDNKKTSQVYYFCIQIAGGKCECYYNYNGKNTKCYIHTGSNDTLIYDTEQTPGLCLIAIRNDGFCQYGNDLKYNPSFEIDYSEKISKQFIQLFLRVVYNEWTNFIEKTNLQKYAVDKQLFAANFKIDHTDVRAVNYQIQNTYYQCLKRDDLCDCKMTTRGLKNSANEETRSCWKNPDAILRPSNETCVLLIRNDGGCQFGNEIYGAYNWARQRFATDYVYPTVTVNPAYYGPLLAPPEINK